MFIKEFDLSNSPWLFEEKGYQPQNILEFESLFTLGNGYLGQRGSLEENPKNSYRGTYIAGIFDKSEAIAPELVKAPGWTDLSIWIEGQKFNFDSCKILEHKRILDVKKGILHRQTRFKDKKGRILKLITKRLVFMHQVRGAVIDIRIIPENFSGNIKLISGLNGDVKNTGFYPNESIKHLNLLQMERGEDFIYLSMLSREKKHIIALASSTIFNNRDIFHRKCNRIYGEKFSEEIIFSAKKSEIYSFTKWVSIYTSREGYDRQIIRDATVNLVRELRQNSLEAELKKHIHKWEHLWNRADISIKGDAKAQKGIRFNLYHLLIAMPHHDPTVGIGAKLLTGEGYKGHAFWDTEIFLLPFYIYTFPEAAKNLLLYRYYTLPGALRNAQANNYKGAKFPWESADTGDEVTPTELSDCDGNIVRIWTGDEEHHIVSDLVYGLYKYVNVTGDKDFLYKEGAEIIFQSALFWLSRVEKRRDRYEIRKVIGPDEFHEHVDNNAFTNYLVTWHLKVAYHLYLEMKEKVSGELELMLKKIMMDDSNFQEMKKVYQFMYLPYSDRNNLIEQFEGYFSLEDVPVTKHDKNGMPMYPKGYDDISKIRASQLVKQADVVLLLYLFPDNFDEALKKKNYQYYEARTMHASSLSMCTYALMGLEVKNHQKAYQYFLRTSYIDLLNLSRNTSDGIHAAATGGAWKVAINGFAGMETRRNTLCFNPWLPKHWEEIAFQSVWQGNIIDIRIDQKNIYLKINSETEKTLEIFVQQNKVKISSKREAKIKLQK